MTSDLDSCTLYLMSNSFPAAFTDEQLLKLAFGFAQYVDGVAYIQRDGKILELGKNTLRKPHPGMVR